MMQASLSLQLKVRQILLLSRLNNKMLSPKSRVASMTEAGWFLLPNLKNLIMVVMVLVMVILVVMELVMELVMMVLVTLLMKTPMTTPTPMTKTIPLEAMEATTILMEVMSTRTPTTPTLLPLLQPTLPA